MPHLQQQFVGLFSNFGGLEFCLGAIEGGMESAEYPETKLKNLQVLLSLMSRVRLFVRFIMFLRAILALLNTDC